MKDEFRCERCSRDLDGSKPVGQTTFRDGTVYDVYRCYMCDHINYKKQEENPMTYEQAIVKIADFYGTDFQIIKTMKELVECADALGHFDEGKCNEDAVYDEIADCEIMFDQLRYLLSTHDSARAEIEKIKAAKIQRQIKRIAGDDV